MKIDNVTKFTWSHDNISLYADVDGQRRSFKILGDTVKEGKNSVKLRHITWSKVTKKATLDVVGACLAVARETNV